MDHCLTKAKMRHGVTYTLTHDGKTAMRPLFTQRGTGYKFFYTCDGNKNVLDFVHFETHGVNVDKSISVKPPIY